MASVPQRWILMLALIVVALGLAACGGGGDDKPTPTATAVPPPTDTPTPRFPPTWTPVPTLTPRPRATVPYTYEPPPVGSPVYLPTRLPTDPPPTIDPIALTVAAQAQQNDPIDTGLGQSITTLVITPDLINDAVVPLTATAVDVFIVAPPIVEFYPEFILIKIDVFVPPENETRPVYIEAELAIDRFGQFELTLKNDYYVDADEDYNQAAGDYVVEAVKNALTTVVDQRHRILNPGINNFEMREFELSDGRLTVEVEATLPTPTPIQIPDPTRAG